MGVMLGVVAALALGVGAPPAPAGEPGPPAAQPAASPPGLVELWAGHQVVTGKRDVPLLGERETRTESWVLARVRRDAAGLELVQSACRIESAPVLGVSTLIAPAAARLLPPTRFRLERDPATGLLAGEWAGGFDAHDWDDDGSPGLGVEVSGPLCSGRVSVTSETTTRARGVDAGDVLSGEVTVDVRQHVLGASARCLLLGGRDGHDEQRGTFTYVRVPDDATCDALESLAWPLPRRGTEMSTSARGS
jgi:hypothetical protein